MQKIVPTVPYLLCVRYTRTYAIFQIHVPHASILVVLAGSYTRYVWCFTNLNISALYMHGGNTAAVCAGPRPSLPTPLEKYVKGAVVASFNAALQTQDVK